MADADLNPEIGRGLIRREPAVDFRQAAGLVPDATPDLRVLEIASTEQRVLVSHDVSTMPWYFSQFRAWADSPGVFLLPKRRPIGSIIEGLLLVWTALEPREVLNQILFLP